MTLSQARRDLAFSRPLEDVVARGLHREPAGRPATVIAFAEEFSAAAAQPAAGPRAGLLGSIRGMFSAGR